MELASIVSLRSMGCACGVMNVLKRYKVGTFALALMVASLAFIGAITTLSSCHHGLSIDKGVPHYIAKDRSYNLSNVEYNICFSIPEERTTEVKGIVSLRFDMEHVEDLQLDYSGMENGSFVNATINGNRYNLMVNNEHLLLPKSEMKKGRNLIEIDFLSSDKVLNRHDDFIYTLFVPASARAAYPCFDQPDIKATYNLTLSTPVNWKAVSNASLKHCDVVMNRNMFHFNTTDPLPSYLFSFVAGEFDTYEFNKDGRTIRALHREKDPHKLAQLEEVCNIAHESISWMEDYTGIPYPFEKYDLIIIPGHPFGGMEHPGAIQYNESKIFLGTDPTPTEIRNRYNLLAHETAHIWFGDMVTMRWFDDVWTKEVFANFMADKIMEDKFPDVDQDLGFVRAHYPLSISTDRTDGTHPLQQKLDNLNSAGLLYGNIIYHKAPIMMRKMEERMGQERLQQALRAYLQTFAYSNATWDDLIEILHAHAPQSNMKEFDKIWVKSEGIPVINTYWKDGKLYVEQSPNSDYELHGMVSDHSSHNAGNAKLSSKNHKKVWPQQLQVGLIYGDKIKVVNVDSDHNEVTVEVKDKPDFIIPNYNGLGYGRFLMNEIPNNLPLKDVKARQALVMNLYENYLMGRLDETELFDALTKRLEEETDPVAQSTIVDCLLGIYNRSNLKSQAKLDKKLVNIAKHHPSNAVKLSIDRALSTHVVEPSALDYVYNRWNAADIKGFTNRDYSNCSYHLASMMPQKAQDILAKQRKRLSKADEQREFDYISAACTDDKEARMELFKSMIEPQGRANEPWARQRLSLLCSKQRQNDAMDYIKPGLDNLEYIQQTSDIFFPGYWLTLLLQNQQSHQAREKVDNWITAHPQLRPGLMHKLKEARYYMVEVEQ